MRSVEPGTLKLLFGAGIHAYAVDLPGYGNSQKIKEDFPNHSSRAEFLLKVRAEKTQKATNRKFKR